MPRKMFVVSLVLAGILSWAGTGTGSAAERTRAVIEVFPGPDALANALAAAQPGDLLNIHAGIYPEDVTVTTRDLTLIAAGDGEVTVDGGCTASTTLDVRARGTILQGLRVIGAGHGFAPIEINFGSVATGRVMDSVVDDTCGNAEYGVNVYQSQTIQIVGNTATGFGDAGFYIGAITSTPRGALVIRRNESYGNVRGIIVENSAGGTIRVGDNLVHDNQVTGIWITNSDGVRIEDNLVMDNGTSGIELDSLSDHNLIRRNTAQGHQYDLANDTGATANCWMDNVYTTSLGDISC